MVVLAVYVLLVNVSSFRQQRSVPNNINNVHVGWWVHKGAIIERIDRLRIVGFASWQPCRRIPSARFLSVFSSSCGDHMCRWALEVNSALVSKNVRVIVAVVQVMHCNAAKLNTNNIVIIDNGNIILRLQLQKIAVVVV